MNQSNNQVNPMFQKEYRLNPNVYSMTNWGKIIIDQDIFKLNDHSLKLLKKAFAFFMINTEIRESAVVEEVGTNRTIHFKRFEEGGAPYIVIDNKNGLVTRHKVWDGFGDQIQYSINMKERSYKLLNELLTTKEFYITSILCTNLKLRSSDQFDGYGANANVVIGNDVPRQEEDRNGIPLSTLFKMLGINIKLYPGFMYQKELLNAVIKDALEYISPSA